MIRRPYMLTLVAALLASTWCCAGELLNLQMAESELGPGPALQPDAHIIKLKTGPIEVGRPSAANATAQIDATVQAAEDALGQPPVYMYYLVHLPGKTDYRDAEAMKVAGFGAIQYIPSNTFIVRCPVDQVQQLAGISGADFIVPVAPEYKIAESVQFFQPPGDAPGFHPALDAAVRLFPGESVDETIPLLNRIKVGVSEVAPDRGSGALLYCAIPEPSLGLVTGLPGVCFVEAQPIETTNNNLLTGQTAIGGDTDRGLTNVYDAWTDGTRPVTGAGQVVGHLDSGLDVGADFGAWTTNGHPALDDRLVGDTGTGVATKTGQYYYQATSGGYYGWDTSTDEDHRAQKFTSVSRGNIDLVVCKITKSSSTVNMGGTYRVRIRSVSSGAPGAVVGTSNTLNGSTISYFVTYPNFTFSTPPAVTEGTEYYLEWDFSGLTNVSSTNKVELWVDAGGVVPAGYQSYDGTTWTTYNFYPAYQRITDSTADRRWSDLTGHGTHTAGTIVSTDTTYRGVAYGATLDHRSAGTNAAGGLSIPADLEGLLDDSYANGARVHSNSWGSSLASENGAYASRAVDVDTFMWNNPDCLVVASSGNSGTDGDSNGIVDATSCRPPSTAKNCVAVGNSETYRTAGDDSYDWYTLNNGIPPFNGTKYVYQQDSRPAAGFGQGMALSSSRGPTDDGRTKPDLVAPGWLMSTWATYNTGATMPTTGSAGTGFKIATGTSMACPAVAGHAALVRDYLVDWEGVTAPTAALIKALLIAGCENLSPGQYGTTGTGDDREMYDNASGTGSPDFAQGYGRVDLAGALGYLDSLDRGWMETIGGLKVTNKARYVTLRAASTTPISAVLVWTDYPATALAATTLINDLDLQIRTSYTGVKDSGSLVAQCLGTINEQTGTDPGQGDDDINTVEKCAIASPTAGTYYTFEVDAETLGNIDGDDQDFALVITGDFDSPTPITVLDFAGRHSRRGARLAWRVADGPDIVGCRVLRASSADGSYEQVSETLVLPEDGYYRFVDRDVDMLLTDAYYKVVGVRSDGLLEEQDSAPFAVGPANRDVRTAWRQ